MDEELSVLKSIYLDELTITYGPTTTVSITIYSDGDENDLDREKRLLCVTVVADLPPTYPESDVPKLTLSRFRGLTDDQLSDLYAALASCLELNQGCCVLYECIETIRSKLSEFEVPHEACAICLTSIDNRLDAIRTNCHHFYHRACLASYVQTKKADLEEKYLEAKKNGFRLERDFRQDIEDPVCRQILASHIIEQLPSQLERTSNDPEENRELIENLSPQMRQWQERTHALFQQQKEKGGIIDVQRNQDIIFI